MPNDTRADSREIEFIIDQMERAFEGDAWYGCSLSEILSDVSAEQALARPIEGAHSIWEIVLHSTVWQRTVRERLQGRAMIELAEDVDWAQVPDTSSSAWAETVGRLRSEYQQLRDEALKWSDRDILASGEGQRYTAFEMLHGIVQHNVYHAGQIALLKKATK